MHVLAFVKKHQAEVAACLVCACGGERSAGGSADNTLSIASPGASPIAVSVETDGSAATSQTVGEAGGELTSIGADSARFTLTIPPKALVAEETITLTPVTSVGDLPLTGGLVAAVHLEPEGLRLLEPATLKVTAVRDINTKDLSGFGYHAMGEEFHLSPYEVDGKTLTARLFHFSGFGWAMTAIGNILKIHHHVPTSPEDRAAQRMSKVAQEARRTGKMDPAAVEAIFRDWYAEEIRPALEQAVTNDAVAVLAGGKFVAWMRQVALLGLDQELGAEMRAGTALFWKAARNAFDKAAERCVKDKDPAHPRQMVTIARMFALFGSDELANELDAKLARCAFDRQAYRITQRRWQTSTRHGIVHDVTVEGRLEPNTAPGAGEDKPALIGTARLQGSLTEWSAPAFHDGCKESGRKVPLTATLEGTGEAVDLPDGKWLGFVFANDSSAGAAELMFKLTGRRTTLRVTRPVPEWGSLMEDCYGKSAVHSETTVEVVPSSARP